MVDRPTPIHVDFETRSKADLKKVGGRVYAAHPTTQVICAVIRCPFCGEETRTDCTAIPYCLFHEEFDACAHNAHGFDKHVWRRLGWPEPRKWYDTAQLARVAGYPKASLDWLGTHLLGIPKDLEGSKLTKALSACFPRHTRRKVDGVFRNVPHAQAGRWRLDPIPPETLARVLHYCASDVQILAGIWPLLEPFCDVDEPFRDVDNGINERGMVFDRELAEAVVCASHHLASEAQAAAGVSAEDVRSPAKLVASLAALGYHVPNAQAATLEALLDDGCEPEAAALIEARLGTSTIAAGKLEAGLARCSADGRLRDTLKYYGAHTGREAGVGLQPQNLPK